MARFTVLLYWDQEEQTYAAQVPTLNFATTSDTIDEALAMAREAAAGRIALMVADGEPILDDEEAPIVAAIEVAVPAGAAVS